MRPWVFAFCLMALSSVLYADHICRHCDPHTFGDVMHRDSTWDAAFVGHAAILLNQIYDVSVGRPVGRALDTISLEKFKEGGPFWGAKSLKEGPPTDSTTTPEGPSPWQDRMRDKVQFLIRTGVDYDYLHFFQKGHRNMAKRLMFDCVGFIEHIWESLGYNPTPDEYEHGLGWPLTVREQRDSPQLEDAAG